MDPLLNISPVPWLLSFGIIPSVETQNMAQVPATSTAIPGLNTPQPSMDCIVSPAPPQTGVPTFRPVASAISAGTCPTTSQGLTILGMYLGSIPRMPSCSSDHLFSRTLYPRPHPDMAPWSMKASGPFSPARCIRM